MQPEVDEVMWDASMSVARYLLPSCRELVIEADLAASEDSAPVAAATIARDVLASLGSLCKSIGATDGLLIAAVALLLGSASQSNLD